MADNEHSNNSLIDMQIEEDNPSPLSHVPPATDEMIDTASSDNSNRNNKRQRTTDLSPPTSDFAEQYLPQFLSKASKLKSEHLRSFEKHLRLRRKKYLSVVIYEKHLKNGTLPKDIMYNKRSSNPYPKDCPNVDALLKKEQELINETLVKIVRERLSVYKELLENCDTRICQFEFVDAHFPELNNIYPPDIQTTCPLGIAYHEFLSDLKTMMNNIREKVQRWNDLCDAKYFREHPNEIPINSSTSANDINTEIITTEPTIDKKVIAPTVMEILQDLKIIPPSTVHQLKPTNKSTNKKPPTKLNNRKNSGNGKQHGNGRRNSYQKRLKRNNNKRRNNNRSHDNKPITSTTNTSSFRDHRSYKDVVVSSSLRNKASTTNIDDIISQLQNLLKNVSSSPSSSPTRNKKPIGRKKYPPSSSKVSNKSHFRFDAGLRGNDQNHSNKR